MECEVGRKQDFSPLPSDRSARLLLVDGHAYGYRAFHAIRGLRSPAGRPTGAVYGFIQMVRRLLKWEVGSAKCEVRPSPFSHAAVVWDGGLAAERVAAWPQYKAQRPPMPEGLVEQLDGMVAWVKASGLASFCREGVEADDGIASLARQWVDGGQRTAEGGMPPSELARRRSPDVVIASSDKDFMQLVSERIGLWNPGDKAERVWAAEQVRERSGVEPAQVVDWLSLVGDSVDNIPGVRGVGAKTAAGLLGEFGSVAGIYGRLGEVKSERVRAALAAAAADVQRNQALVRLRTDVAGDFSPDALVVRAPDAAALRGLYADWGFRSLLAELGPATATAQGCLW